MSGIVMWVSALAIAAALAVGVSQVGLAAIEDSRAATAADAAALAGAADGAGAASEAASRNGANLVSLRQNGQVTSVVVSVGNATAEAHAKRILVSIR